MFVYAVDIEPIRCANEGRGSRPSQPSTPVSVINLFTVVIYVYSDIML